MLEHGQICTDALLTDAETKLNKMFDRSSLQQTQVEPAIYLKMSDSWIEITLPYIVDAQERRAVKGKLHSELLQRFQTKDEITIASPTIEIVGFPSLLAELGNAGVT